MVKVVAALIKNKNKILIAKRLSGSLIGKWEFPGGKVEDGEIEERAIEREIKEEFGVKIQADEFLINNEFKYPNKLIDLRLYACNYIEGEFKLHVHSEYKWVKPEELLSYDFAPADIALAKYVKEIYNMDKGVIFVLDNCKKTLEIVNEVEEYKDLKNLVTREYYYLKSIKYTGNMYEHFLKYKSGNHKYAEKFKFLNKYGIISNEKMSDYLKENYPNELNNFWSIDDLIVGNTYTNNEIASTFKCSNMGGMRRALGTNSLVLIAKHTNPLYDDQWSEDGVLNYTGMGTKGNQSIEFAQNKTLANAKSEGIKVYLFESYKDNEYYYNGEVEVVGPITKAEEIDIDGKIREVLKYPLKLKEENKRIVIDSESLKNSIEIKEKEVKKLSYDELKKSAMKIKNKTYSKRVSTVYRDRDPIVSQYTKKRANGYCDLCGNKAPFENKSQEPFLETHHLITLADGGPDVIYNTVALCPNCHKKMHVLNEKNDFMKLVEKIRKYVQQENEEEQMKEFKKLFNI